MLVISVFSGIWRSSDNVCESRDCHNASDNKCDSNQQKEINLRKCIDFNAMRSPRERKKKQIPRKPWDILADGF